MITENICLSGGAKGADVLFGQLAVKSGHKVIHYGFQGMSQSNEEFWVLSQVQLLEADPHLKRANETLKRTFPTQSVYVNSLLRRNYWQIKNTERVYAVAPIKDGMVVGGTAWAVQMAIDKGIPEIYVFNLNNNVWWTYEGSHELFRTCVLPSKPHGVYTGIGSRGLTDAGRAAIDQLYHS